MTDQPDQPCVCGHSWREHDPIGRCQATNTRERPSYRISMPCGCAAYTERASVIVGFAAEQETKPA